MSCKEIVEKEARQAKAGNIKSVLMAIESDFGSTDAIGRLADTAAKRDEAIMCLRLIAGLDPRLRNKAEATIELLAKVPFPPVDEH